MKINSIKNRLSSDPFLDWVLILALSLIAMLTLVGVGIYVYLETDKSLSQATPAVKPADLPLDEHKLGSVLNEFDSRSARSAAIMKTYSAPKDPSLP